jgi:hypothetical protein
VRQNDSDGNHRDLLKALLRNDLAVAVATVTIVCYWLIIRKPLPDKRFS